MPKTLPKVLALAIAPLALLGYRGGPPAGMTGGFGEVSCLGCHADNDVNAPGGTLAVTGVPEAYKAGESYRLTVSLSRADLMRGGFQIASRFADGKQAGAWRRTDGRTRVVTSDQGVQYAEQSLLGSGAAAAGTVEWIVEWTAPMSGDVQFHVAANAANDDGKSSGDFIYLGEYRSGAAR